MGSTNLSKYDLNKRTFQANNFAAIEFEELAGRANKRVKQGEYNEILENAKNKFNLMKDVNLPKGTIHSMLQGNQKLLVAHPGPESHMRAVVVYLLDIILQLAAMHQPINPIEAIELTNSLIKGTLSEQEVLSWKKKSFHDENEVNTTLG